MAEVVNIPKVSQSSLTRESSSLSRPKQEKPQVKSVEFEGGVKVKQKGFGEKLKETFIKQDLEDVRDYIIWDIIVPTIARTINDIICGTSNRIFLGSGYSSSSGNLYRERGVTLVKRTDYGSVSTRTVQARESRSLPERTEQRRSSFSTSDVRFDLRESAEKVLDSMVDYLDVYPFLTVNDFFEMAKAGTPPYTVENWGWRQTDIAMATIEGDARQGYFIKLPSPKYSKE